MLAFSPRLQPIMEEPFSGPTVRLRAVWERERRAHLSLAVPSTAPRVSAAVPASRNLYKIAHTDEAAIVMKCLHDRT